MGNIDEKRLSVLLGRIDNIRAELEALENEVRGLGPATSESHETGSAVSLGSSVSEATVPAEVSSAPIDETPIEIDIQDIDIPPIIGEPAAGPVSPVTSSGSETEAAEAVEPSAEIAAASDSGTASTPPATGTAQPVTGPAKVTASVETLEPAGGTEPAEVAEPAETVTPTEAPGNQPEDDLPFDDDFPIPEPEPEPEPKPKPKAAILDSKKAGTAVMDVMADNQAWRTDRPGSQVKNVISAISLNDRVLLINVLFKEDPMLFQGTISAFNAMATLDEAVDYIQTNFPDWNLNSEPVYRLMMAVRRKLR